jgi:hypothetical protein
VHKWRNRYPGHPDYSKAVEKSDDTELADAADDVYSVAAGHRETVIAKDKAAKARRKRSRG